MVIGRRTTAAWAPAILAVLALLFASSPILAGETPVAPMAMATATVDESDSNGPCDPAKITCARLCVVLCHGLVPTPAAVVHLLSRARLGHRPAADPLVGVEPESEDPPPRT